jgi:hypothetical protein
MLRGLDWWLFTDVSGEPIGTISKGPAIQEERDCLTFEDGTDKLLEKSVNNYHSTPRKAPEEGRSHLHRGINVSDWLKTEIRVTWKASFHLRRETGSISETSFPL